MSGPASGCKCDDTPAPAPTGPPALHYVGFDALVDRAAMGDREAAKVAATDLVGGEPARWDGEGGEDAAIGVGGALGFVSIAEDADELADGVASAARHCGACHEAARVVPEDARPDWTHATAARWATWGLVWNEPISPPPSDDVVLKGLAEELAAPLPAETGIARTPAIERRDRVARLIGSCARCHAKSE